MLFRADNIPVEERARLYALWSNGMWAVDEPEAVTEEGAPLEDRVEGNRRFIRLSRYRNGPRLAYDGDANTARLFVRGPIDSYWGFDAERAVDILEGVNPASVVVDLATPGGLVEEASTFWAGMRRLAEDGMGVDSVASGLVASAGMPMMTVGEKRSAVASANFMAHAPYVFSLAVLNRAKAASLAQDVGIRLAREEDRLILMMTERGVGQASARRWMDGRDHWLSPSEAYEAGVLTVEPAEAPAEGGDDGGEPAGDDPPQNTAEGPDSGQVYQLTYYGPFFWSDKE